MENSLLVIFGEIWPKTLTIVQGLWPDFGATLKIHKKSNFARNKLKLETQHNHSQFISNDFHVKKYILTNALLKVKSMTL